MKNLKNIIGACVCIIALASCSITVPHAVTNTPVGSKKGISESLYIFGIELNGEFGIAEAAKKGKIKGGISTVDLKTTTFFGPLVYKRELIVTGHAE